MSGKIAFNGLSSRRNSFWPTIHSESYLARFTIRRPDLGRIESREPLECSREEHSASSRWLTVARGLSRAG
jgi:hypothetical protein